MSSQRYRRLITNLPSMASVVNAFHSPEVQLSVYLTLIEAMEDALDDNEPRLSSSSVRKSSRNGKSDDGALADLVEGDSIHSVVTDA